MIMRLSKALLGTMAATSSNNPGNVALPTYDRDAVEAGILHFGVGNFQTAFSQAYIDDLLGADDNFESHKKWGIVGASVPPHGKSKREALEPQDWLVTLVEKDDESTNPRILGSMIDHLPIDTEAVHNALMDEKIKIVSMTVTEGGYYLNDGKFDAEDPDMKKDGENPDDPKTVFGILVKALKQRKEEGKDPFTVMSCDNVPENGCVCKSVVVGLAKLSDEELGKWIDDKVSFPNSMVDRITPATTDDQKDYVKENFGYEDATPVFCEPFHQWVLEDDFVNGVRPELDILDNVKFTNDVGPYEFMKLRILNGGHASLCYPSALLDLDFVHEAMEHETIGPFLDHLEQNEIIPTVKPIPDDDIDFVDYWKTTAERFSNPTLSDTIRRNCFDGASRQPKFTIPVAKDNLEADRAVDGIALVNAMWCRYCMGETESGKEIEPNDPKWDKLHELACKARDDDPLCWLGMSDVYGKVGEDERFQAAFKNALTNILDNGVEETMKMYTSGKLADKKEEAVSQ